MKKYTKQQSRRLSSKIFGATTSKGSIQVKAILKENALIAIQKYDSSFEDIEAITELKNTWNSHQACFDRVVEKYPNEFVIEIAE